jgi:uncharacterized protein YecT (DUF1311 family)
MTPSRAGILVALLTLAALSAAGTARAQTACNQGTTYDIRSCWSKQDVAADSALQSTVVKATAALHKAGVDPALLAAAQAAWVTARDKSCTFEYELYLPGTIAPQLGVQCDVRMTRARTRRLAALLAALQTKGVRPAELPVGAAADAELNRLYALYAARLTGAQRSALAASERAWKAYRDKACALEGGRCLTELERERVAELEASWVGEAFW